MSGERDINGGWSEYKKLVVHELSRLNNEIKSLREEVHDDMEQLTLNIAKVDRDLLELRIKASIWGAIAGFLASVGTQVTIQFLLRR